MPDPFRRGLGNAFIIFGMGLGTNVDKKHVIWEGEPIA